MEHLQAHQELRETMRFRLSSRQPGFDTYVIAVEGELDLFRAPELKELFLELVGEGARRIVVDLAATTFVDSTALALLMSLPRLVEPGVVAVACNNPRILKAFEITGTDRQVPIETNVEPALQRVDPK